MKDLTYPVMCLVHRYIHMEYIYPTDDYIKRYNHHDVIKCCTHSAVKNQTIITYI